VAPKCGYVAILLPVIGAVRVDCIHAKEPAPAACNTMAHTTAIFISILLDITGGYMSIAFAVK
jgi:hypothetical protein